MQASCRLHANAERVNRKKYNDNPLAGVKTVNVNFVLFSNFAPHIIFLFFFLFQIFNNLFWLS